MLISCHTLIEAIYCFYTHNDEASSKIVTISY